MDDPSRVRAGSIILPSAARATSERRNTVMPEHLPLGLQDEFTQDKSKNIQWNAFLKKNQLAHIQLNVLLIDLRNKLGYLFTK
jgi:hypothetical protein